MICMSNLIHTTTRSIVCMELPQQLRGKVPTWPCRRCRRRGLHLCIRKIPWGRKWQPPPVFLPGKSHGQRNLVGYSPRDQKVRHNWSDCVWHDTWYVWYILHHVWEHFGNKNGTPGSIWVILLKFGKRPFFFGSVASCNVDNCMVVVVSIVRWGGRRNANAWWVGTESNTLKSSPTSFQTKGK